MTKTYAFIVEDDQIVAVEVDGVRYASVDDIPDPVDRSRMFLMTPFTLDVAPGTGKAFPVEKVVLAVFLVVAALMLSAAAVLGVANYRELARERTASGKVVDLVVRKDSEGNEFTYPVVQFDLPDGTRKTVELPEGSRPPAFEKGQAVTVRYDPEEPTDARTDSASTALVGWVVPGITGVLGLAFAAGSLLAVWIIRTDPHAKRPERGHAWGDHERPSE